MEEPGPKPRVTIIGAGFAGLTLSLLLQKNHIPSIIYEARPITHLRPGSIALAPNALRVLSHCGIYPKIQSLGHNYEKVAFCTASGKRLGDFLNGSEEIYGFPAIRVGREAVRKVLLEEVLTCGIEIRWGMRCIDVVSEDDLTSDKVKIRFQDGTIVDSEYVIGADGLHSQIRPFLSATSVPVYTGTTGIGGKILARDLKYTLNDYGISLPCMLFGERGHVAIMPGNYEGSEIGFFSGFELEGRDRRGWVAFEGDKKGLRGILSQRFLEKGGWPSLVRELCEKCREEDLVAWPQFAIPKLNTWLSPKKRVIIIGDAAHAIPPTGGQGAAMALEDAETLAYAFTFIFRKQKPGDPEPHEILRSWQNHRIKRVQKITDFTNQSSALRKPSNGVVKRLMKEYMMRLFFMFRKPGRGQNWMYAYDAVEESFDQGKKR